MSWRDRLQGAEIDGVPFHVHDAGGTGGRRVAVHEYPLQEIHDTEDMGRKAGDERLTAFVLGTDYDLAKQKLIDVLNKPGIRNLTHPYKGIMRIRVTGYDWQITTREGGYCKFTINYVTAGKTITPVSANNAALLSTAALACNGNIYTEFSNTFSIENKPAHVFSAAQEQLSDALTKLRDINGKMGAAMQPLSDLSAGIDSLGTELSTLIRQPAVLIDRFVGVIAAIIGTYNDIDSAFNSYKNLVDGFSVRKPISKFSANGTQTESRVAMSRNQVSTADALQGSTAVALVTVIAKRSALFSTYGQAIEIRDVLLAQLDTMATASHRSYNDYRALVNLQTTLMRHINDIAPGLQRVDYVRYETSLPALVIAHQLYGDAKRADELVIRNKVKHPLFMPAGTDMEILL